MLNISGLLYILEKMPRITLIDRYRHTHSSIYGISVHVCSHMLRHKLCCLKNLYQKRCAKDISTLLVMLYCHLQRSHFFIYHPSPPTYTLCLSRSSSNIVLLLNIYASEHKMEHLFALRTRACDKSIVIEAVPCF